GARLRRRGRARRRSQRIAARARAGARPQGSNPPRGSDRHRPTLGAVRYTSRMSSIDRGRKAGLRRELESLLGKGSVLSDPEELLVYESDGLTLFQAVADFVVAPTAVEQVSAVVRLANRESLPFVARGAGTGLSGGCLPAEGGLVISLMRMNRVLEVDYENQIAVVEPGLV